MIFELRNESINALQQTTLQETIKRARQAHYTNIVMRIDGRDVIVEADWIKHLHLLQTPIDFSR